ncbi:hypothetical protein AVEN_43364-1 [Araneus ventricosus]|uniref:Uncharacterized protein n=1 Tax=Araneus ventricosus TaxID=182803 RepID=A0A4Y2TLP3_ARAVE|nr:hypothetical protein AVEN_79695-1 [Araneus ventricosus]GBO01543.1 hypothetical protein AVEN_146405-1 [Araneus ventricosus]GBO01628.1 hypothetical protein AVEN_43364-1 [Araneus ventricosus]
MKAVGIVGFERGQSEDESEGSLNCIHRTMYKRGLESSARPSPRVHSPIEEKERFMVKEESAASVDTKPWTPEGRSLPLSIAFML